MLVVLAYENKLLCYWWLKWEHFCKIYDQQLVELKDLYDAEQLLSAELGEKLGKTQVPF